MRVWIHHRLPSGSRTRPTRSPKNRWVTSVTDVPPAETARWWTPCDVPPGMPCEQMVGYLAAVAAAEIEELHVIDHAKPHIAV